jgi:hypothetical protein
MPESTSAKLSLTVLADSNTKMDSLPR